MGFAINHIKTIARTNPNLLILGIDTIHILVRQRMFSGLTITIIDKLISSQIEHLNALIGRAYPQQLRIVIINRHQRIGF